MAEVGEFNKRPILNRPMKGEGGEVGVKRGAKLFLLWCKRESKNGGAERKDPLEGRKGFNSEKVRAVKGELMIHQHTSWGGPV